MAAERSFWLTRAGDGLYRYRRETRLEGQAIVDGALRAARNKMDERRKKEEGSRLL
jgi:hypothetical protein